MAAMERWVEREVSPWPDAARALQLRIRDRFRVAVDRHRSRWSEDQDYSSALQRLILRARSLWMDHSSRPPSSPYRFYRKRVDNSVVAMDDSIIVRMLQALAVPVIGNVCHVFMHGFNHIQIFGVEKLHQALLQRPEGKPLMTVSNHVASVDDPLIIASLLPPTSMLDARNLRWTLCATDRCFRNPLLTAFFRCVKVLPVSRGDGVYQKGMDMAISKLNNGGWVHIFPEGSRSRDGGRTMGSSKRGVGRLVIDSDNIPVVVPFVHMGMQEIMPIGTRFPKIGKKVTILVGDPIYFDDLLLNKDDPQCVSSGILYDAVSSRIGLRLQELKVQVDRLALEQPSEVRECYRQNNECAYGIWQRVDWEAFGMEGIMSSGENSQTVRQVILDQQKQTLDQSEKAISTNRTIRMGFSYEGDIVSRIRGYMNPSELMGFAARGLFMNRRMLNDYCPDIPVAGPLKAWKQFVEGNIFKEWSSL